MLKRQLVAIVLFLVLGVIPLLAQNANSNLAKNKYMSGMAFYKEGKYQEALKDFDGVIEKFPKSEWAALSLLQKGLYLSDVAGNPSEAKAQFEKFIQEFPSHKKAPYGLLKMGEIQLSMSDEINKLNDPIATFERIIRTYPSTDYAAEASYKMADIFFRLGNLQRSMEKIKTVDERYTKSAFYADAMLLKATILITNSEYVEAAKLLQVLSDSKQGKSQGAQAKKLLNAIQRMKLDSNHKYKTDPSFKLDINNPLKAPKSVYLDAAGQLYVFDAETKTVNVYDGKGAVSNTITSSLEVISHLLCKDGKNVLVDSEGGIDSEGTTASLTFSDGEESRPVLKPRWIRDNSFGNLFVVSKKGDHIFRYDSSMTFRMRVSSYEFEEIKSLEIDNFGKLYVIDKSYNGILIFNPTGSEAGRIAGETSAYNLKEPVIMKFDRFNHLFVYDQGLEAFIIFDNARHFVKQVNLPPQVDELIDFAIADSGEIYILDEDSKTIVKIL